MPVPDTLSRISDDDPQWYVVGNLDNDCWCLLRAKGKIFLSSGCRTREILHFNLNDPIVKPWLHPVDEDKVLLTLLKYGISI